QGADVADGAVWISTSDAHNDVYRVDLTTGDTTSVGTLGHEGLEGEGIDATPLASGAFHALVNNPAGPFVIFGHYDLSSPPETEPSSETVPSAPGAELAKTGGAVVPIDALLGLFALSVCAWRLRGRRP